MVFFHMQTPRWHLAINTNPDSKCTYQPIQVSVYDTEYNEYKLKKVTTEWKQKFAGSDDKNVTNINLLYS